MPSESRGAALTLRGSESAGLVRSSPEPRPEPSRTEGHGAGLSAPRTAVASHQSPANGPLQNRQGVAAPRLEGSIPSPLRPQERFASVARCLTLRFESLAIPRAPAHRTSLHYVVSHSAPDVDRAASAQLSLSPLNARLDGSGGQVADEALREVSRVPCGMPGRWDFRSSPRRCSRDAEARSAPSS